MTDFWIEGPRQGLGDGEIEGQAKGGEGKREIKEKKGRKRERGRKRMKETEEKRRLRH